MASDRADRLSQELLRDLFPRQSVFPASIASIAAIWQRRELLGLLVRREIRAKYKDSTLGLVWSLIRPLVLLAIYYVVIGKFLGATRMIANFPIHLYAGLTLWTLFQEAVFAGTGSILSNAAIVKKTALPREIFPLTSIGAAGFNFIIQLVILIVAVAFTTGFDWSIGFLHFPLAILIIVTWATAFALLLSALNVYMRDVQHLVEVVLMIGFYVSPVIYSWGMAAPHLSGVLQEIYLANPITLAVMGTQRVVWDPTPAYPWPSHLALRMLIVWVIGLAAVFLAQRLFNRLQSNFAQEI
ncbi:MAG: ABC transporter permease [Propionibacteriaceae bacterium]|nr:ABC transporter permease [Propionibacteriaceae bacterium]